jgi:hypothetical protein
MNPHGHGSPTASSELARESVCAKFAHTAEDGKVHQTHFYNIDAKPGDIVFIAHNDHSGRIGGCQVIGLESRILSYLRSTAYRLQPSSVCEKNPAIVILSTAKNLAHGWDGRLSAFAAQILRCAQDDKHTRKSSQTRLPY